MKIILFDVDNKRNTHKYKMKQDLKFHNGEFITQISYPDVFAIFGGTAYDPIEPGGEMDYSLICYYNPSHFTQNSEGKWDSEVVFEYDLEDDKKCEYTLNKSDMEYWRPCTDDEKLAALKILADKERLAWDDEKKHLRKLYPNERLIEGNNSEYKNNSHAPNSYLPSQTQIKPLPPVAAKKTITLLVNEAWEQGDPITTMDGERRELIAAECDRLKYSFSSYSNSMVAYPQNGSQVPRRNYYDGSYYGGHWWQEGDYYE